MSSIEWSRRATVRRTEVAILRRYKSIGGRFAVVQVKSTLGLPMRWLAIERDTETSNEVVISRHRTSGAARQSCESRCRRQRKGSP